MRSIQDQEKWWEFLKTATVRGPHELRAHLRVDESSFRLVAGYSHADPRGYFLYKVLDEVQKTGVEILQWVEFLSAGPKEEGVAGQTKSEADDRHLNRVILEAIADDQSMRLRKLTETLVSLICFDRTDEDDYYRHYLLLSDLELYLSMEQDLREFHACPSRNLAQSIRRTIEWASQLEQSTVVTSRCWYLADRRPLSDKKPKAGRIFSSFRSRLRTALPIATAEEKLAIGLSYQVFGKISRDIHFTPSAPDFHLSPEGVAADISHCGLVAMPILLRCQRIIGIVPDGINQQIRKTYETNEYPKRLLRSTTQERAEVGEFVLAYGDLAEVLEIARSAFGYEAYRVRYLAERPLPEVDEDWFPAKYIRRLYTRNQFLLSLDQLAAADELPGDVVARMKGMNSNLQQEALRESIVHVWKAGLRDYTKKRVNKGETD